MSFDLSASIAGELITNYIILKRQGERHRQDGFDWEGMPVITEEVLEELGRDILCYDESKGDVSLEKHNNNFQEWCEQIDRENSIFGS